MIRLIITLAVLFFISENSFSQEESFNRYYKLVNQANDAYDSGNYKQAGSYFDNAFKLVKHPFAKNLERASEVNIRNHDCKKASVYAEKAATIGYIIKDTLINSLTNLCKQNAIKALLNDKMNIALTSKNQNFIHLIDSLYRVDQNFRNNRKAFLDKGNIDSMNLNCLLDGIKHTGFPSEDNVGYEASDKAFIIFLHADFDLSNSLLGPILLKALQKGEFRPVWYAQIADRRSNFSGEPFLYYQVPFGYDKLTKEEKAVVTERREEIGLRSVEKTIEYKIDAGGTLRTRTKE